MNLFLYVMFAVNLIIPFSVFNNFAKKRRLFTDRYGATITSASAYVFSLSTGTLLFFVFSPSLVNGILLSTAVGVFLGVSYGLLIKFHSLLLGVFYGMLGAWMGTMLAAVIADPALCGLPSSFTSMLLMNKIIITGFLSAISVLTALLLRFSFRV
ncbi:hypothetical protein [Peribacillus sp. SCS-155]|uniref:hypothetical protein n=1 Tax=Peribacillus sedimenti TaxID=3115297 RepID=UPI00390697A9